jgi:putative hydrolase of the HAD superfamily
LIEAIVSDFGGVLTLPLNEAFARAHDDIGIPVDAHGRAMRLDSYDKG